MLDLGLLVLRAVFGLCLAAHGAQKACGWFGGPGVNGATGFFGSLGLRPARFWAVTAAVAELGGGLLIALGLLGPVGPALALAVMIAAAWLVHRPHGFWASNGGIEYPTMTGAVALALALTGFGRYALDRVLDLGLHAAEVVAAALILAVVGAVASIATTRFAARPLAQAPTGA
jgi:putative oxidoreductase